VYFAAVVLAAAGMIVFSYVLGQRHHERATGEPYESGMPTTGTARLRLAANFYLVAMFFVIFDLESVFIFAWAIAVRSLGWAGFAAVAWFIAILAAALAYLWKAGSLDWGPRRPSRAPREVAAPPAAEPHPGEARATVP